MVTTRQRITAHIALRPQTTTSDIARSLRITAADVRHHLRDLIKEGVITISGARPGSGRGRPLRTYAITKNSQENNLSLLASTLIDVVSVGMSPERLEEILMQVADKMAGVELFVKETGSKRLLSTVQKLNELHYQARWEAHRGAPRVILGHCPYFAIVEKHPELCSMDASLIRKLVGKDANLLKKQATDANGSKYCLFQIDV